MESPQIKEADQELKVFIKSFPRGKALKEHEITYATILQDKFLLFKAEKHGVNNALFQEIKTIHGLMICNGPIF